MPIIHHKETGNKFFFIHIPRTAGRFLVENLGSHGCEIVHPFIDSPLSLTSPYVKQTIEGIEMLHAHRSIYNKWNKVKDISHFTIVRNPIDRFFSARARPDLNLSLSYVEDWNNFNKEFSKKHYRNWFRPQHEFVSSETKIWKYENGFGKDFCSWISDIVSFLFTIKSSHYQKIETKAKFKKTKALIDNIKKFYRKDFQLLGVSK
jgi:hypothetical protein